MQPHTTTDGYSFRYGSPQETILLEARDKLGAPYAHLGEGPGRYDAWGLARACVAFASGRDDLESPERADWGVATTSAAHDTLASWGLVPTVAPMPGDLLLYRMDGGRVHVAILSDVTGPERKIIHAYWGRHVVESWEGPFWRNKLIGAWTLPVERTDWPMASPGFGAGVSEQGRAVA